MLGSRPRKLTPPSLQKAQRVSLPNGPDLHVRICSLPIGEYIVEQVGKFYVAIKKPNQKKLKSETIEVLRQAGCDSPSDFVVWVIEPNAQPWVPKHYQTLKAFGQLSEADQERLLRAICDVVFDYAEPSVAVCAHNCGSITLDGYPALLVLSYLKWIAALEDTQYPPPEYLGRRMAVAGYFLISTGRYSPSDLRKVLKVF